MTFVWAVMRSIYGGGVCEATPGGGPVSLWAPARGAHTRGASQRSASSVNSTPCLSRDNSRNSASGSTPAPTSGSTGQNSMHVQTSFDGGFGVHSYLGKDGKRGETGDRDRVINDVYKKTGGQPTPLVTVINADNETAAGAKQQTSGAAGAFLGSRGPGLCMTISGAPSPRQLSRQGSSIESSTVHTHTVECAGSLASARLHQPVTQSHTRGSPTSNECDFHCCSLHAGHANQSSHKTVATSPVQVSRILCSPFDFFSLLRNLM